MNHYQACQLMQNPKYEKIVEGWLEGRSHQDPFISEQYTTDKLLRRLAGLLVSDSRRFNRLENLLEIS